MDCIDLFKRAAMALQTDPRYLALDQARKANDKDEELQNLIGEFNLARMDLNNEISKSERSDERIAELNTKVNDLYGKIMADEGMTAYNEAKRDCENPAPAAAPPAAAATNRRNENAAANRRPRFPSIRSYLLQTDGKKQSGIARRKGERLWQNCRP